MGNFFTRTYTFMKTIHTYQRTPFLLTRRKTCILGFMTTISFIKSLCSYLLHERSYSYFLTYRTSQDHIEILFSKIRQGGFNNNPSASLFKNALRAILISDLIKPPSSANVQIDDSTSYFKLDFRASTRCLFRLT